MRKHLSPVLLAVWVCSSCAPKPVVAASPAPQAAPAPASTLPASIQWMQSSAEYVGIAVQMYRLATSVVETAARGRAPGTWAAVLDADDTVINNLSYQAGLVLEGARHTPERFTAFVRTHTSTAVPGAAKFLARVHELGGRIGIVTNRLSIECDDTAAMLRQLSLAFDAVICRPEGAPVNADKTPRYEAISTGQTSVSRTPVEILVFVGDNILDFPNASQARRAQGESGFTEFGVRWFLLPNPMVRELAVKSSNGMRPHVIGLVSCLCLSAACHHASQPARQPAARPGAATQPAVTDADVKFMQGMIGHHTQAIEMAALLKTRTTRDDMKLLGQRIEVSQNDEIRMMRTWLTNHKQPVPADSDYKMMMAMPDMAMPGMLTQKEMDQLAAVRGADFDRLFLEGMIQHHQGALTMVKTLMTTPGAGQDSSVFAFASEVEADQSAEITRMRALRATMGK